MYETVEVFLLCESGKTKTNLFILWQKILLFWQNLHLTGCLISYNDKLIRVFLYLSALTCHVNTHLVLFYLI